VIDGAAEGATSPDGKVFGTYMHGLFASDPFRRRLLSTLGVDGGGNYRETVETALDGIAAALETHIDCDALFAIAR
jgi:adenosylcobyric acid synthase